MKLIVSSDGIKVINAERVKEFWIDISQPVGYHVYADEIEISHHNTIEGARKNLKSLTESLTCVLSSDIVLHLEDME